MKRLFVALLLGCGNEPAAGPAVCEGSTPDPAAECGEGYCVNGDSCEPIFDECGRSEVPILGGGCRRVGLPEDCWDGWLPDGDDGCEPIMAANCPSGTMPVIGQTECQPVGVPQDCWPGWVNDGDGGCEPIPCMGGAAGVGARGCGEGARTSIRFGDLPRLAPRVKPDAHPVLRG